MLLSKDGAIKSSYLLAELGTKGSLTHEWNFYIFTSSHSAEHQL